VKVGIIQSNYLPWRGYFDLIDDVDLFVFYDDVQYTRLDWRNRNKIKTPQGTEWLTVSVDYSFPPPTIRETKIKYANRWNAEHIRKLELWYSHAPYFDEYMNELRPLLLTEVETISTLNRLLCKWIMEKLSISTPVVCSADFKCTGLRSERLIDLLEKVSATSYLSGPSAQSYIDAELFKSRGIALEYKTYDYAPYPQLHGEFIGAVTVLDLLFNVGPRSRDFLKSRSANLAVT
jgi:hypothetical protein